MGTLPREIFRRTAEARFSALDRDYIKRKFEEERFPVTGNRLMSNYLLRYLRDNPSLKSKKEILLLDIGSAGGALSTLFAIDALDKAGLLTQARILLVDVANNALKATVEGNFTLPPKFIKANKLGRFGSNGGRLRGILAKQAKYFCADTVSLPKEIRNVDICISGFTHHHLNLADKKLACGEMERVTRLGGFVGIADESLAYRDYLAWLKFHAEEKNSSGMPVPIAQECFIALSKHVALFKRLEARWKNRGREYYCFAGVKK